MDGAETIRHRGRRFKRASTERQERASFSAGERREAAAVPPPLVSSSLLKCRRVLPNPAPPQLINRGTPLPDKRRPQSDSTLIRQFQHQRFKPLPSIGVPPLLLGGTSTHGADIVETDSAVDLNYTSSSPSPNPHPPTPSLPPTITPHSPVRPLSTKLMLSGRSLLARKHCNSQSLNTNTSNNCCTPIHSIAGRHGSIPEEPHVDDPFAVLLCVKIPNGSRVERRFRRSDLLCHVVTFALQHCKEEEEEDWELITSDVPRKVFSNLSLSLREAGLESRTLLHLTPL